MPYKALLIGHSLVGPVMPRMLSTLLNGNSAGSRADAQVINGATLLYNWQNGAQADGVNARAVIPRGGYSTVIMTEALPIAGQVQWSDTFGASRNYYQLAMKANPNTQVMIYETWPEFGNSNAAWRASLTSDKAVWQSVVNNLNATRGAGEKAATLLPAGQAMAELYDTIGDGNGLGLRSIHQIFSDNVHLNDAGSYFVAMMHYGAITGKSPVGLTSNLSSEFGGAYTGWTPAQAVLFQHIAWEKVAPASAPKPLLIEGKSANETLRGGKGDDRIYGNGGSDVIYGGAGRDLLTGGASADTIYGGKDNDWLFGGKGNDRLFGEDHNDVIYGEKGRDQLTGGKGNDTLYGGSDADIFIFADTCDRDQVADFNGGQGDRLQLNANLWTGRLTADQVVRTYAHDTAAGIVFDFGGGDTITLTNQHNLSSLGSMIVIG